MNRKFDTARRSVAVAFDSRIQSDEFCRVVCEVLSANGIRVHRYAELMPVPCLSYAVRALGCAVGVMITASHNPAQYNGYKVYGSDGCQIRTEVAKEILGEVEAVDEFADVRTMDYDEAVKQGLVSLIGEEIYTAFTEEVKKRSVLFGDEINRDVAIVYSPLNGAGRKPVMRALTETGFTNITVVKEQENPDGHFPTCPYPNPEIREAMALGLSYCEKLGADLLLATDPDCDRCGVAVKDVKGLRGKPGEYTLMTGNEMGILLLDFICSQRKKHGKMPNDPVFVKTIVTAELTEKIASYYGVKTVSVLTGFKYIGEVIGNLEREGKADSYIFGFEESYGYLSGSHVRDKDAVNASYLFCEMFAYYKTRDVSLPERLAEIYAQFGYSLQTLHSFQFEGSAGMTKMKTIMKDLRGGVDAIGGFKVESVLDYANGVNGLPKADVLTFRLEGGNTALVRPSGTEPKLKAYLFVTAPQEAAAREIEKKISEDLKARFA